MNCLFSLLGTQTCSVFFISRCYISIDVSSDSTKKFLLLHLQALLQALGDRKGINRFGDFSAPLDEALIHVSLVCYSQFV